MSHFSVLVAGDVEKQLAPYHEYECTGVFDEYVEAEDITENLKHEFQNQSEYESFEKFVEYYEGPFRVFNSYQEAVNYSSKLDPLFVFAVKSKDAEDIETVYRFTNPSAKWDWFVIGGRWSNFLLAKDGKRYDSLKKKDIDFEGMVQDAAKQAEKDYDAFQELLEKQNVTDPKELDSEALFQFYQEQGKMFLREEFDGVSKNEYIKKAKDAAIMTFAFVKDGVWHEKAEMGWFAVTCNEKQDWPEIFNDLLESVDDEETLTVVDCHI